MPRKKSLAAVKCSAPSKRKIKESQPCLSCVCSEIQVKNFFFLRREKQKYYDVIVADLFSKRSVPKILFNLKVQGCFPVREYRLAMKFSDRKITCGLLTNFNITA